MKNILIWINPSKVFVGEPLSCIKIQIDNSLDLGWKKEDIILATNFDFEYNGVKSIVVKDENFLPNSPRESKQKAILELFDRGFIKINDLYWFHDLDAFQSEVITEEELELGSADMALTDYCWREKWSTGSIFFKESAKDIFEGLVEMQRISRSSDEVSLMFLTKGFGREVNYKWVRVNNPEYESKIPKVKDISNRIKKLNSSYNFVPYFNIKKCYEEAIKPIKVAHFHLVGGWLKPFVPNLLYFYMYGDNEINTVLIPERLIKIIQSHGVK